MRAQNARSGAGDNQFGVSLGDIRVLAKKIRTNHELALPLWETGNIDARFLAALLIQPTKLSAREMDQMVRSIAFVRVADSAALVGPGFRRTTGAQIPVDGGNDRVI